jgi:hypothetical protein
VHRLPSPLPSPNTSLHSESSSDGSSSVAKRRADKAPIDKCRPQFHEHCESNVVDGPEDSISVKRSDGPCSDLPVHRLPSPNTSLHGVSSSSRSSDGSSNSTSLTNKKAETKARCEGVCEMESENEHHDAIRVRRSDGPGCDVPLHRLPSAEDVAAICTTGGNIVHVDETDESNHKKIHVLRCVK